MAQELATIPTNALDFREFGVNTPIVIDAGGLPIVMTVSSAMKLLCPGAPAGEVLQFLLTCKQAGLNPWLKEAELLPPFGTKTTKWTIVVRKGGYLKHSVSNSAYDGHRSGIVIVTDQGKRVESEGTIMPPTAVLLGGWCEVWRKGVSRPLKRVVSLVEFDTGLSLWKTKTCTMIEKCAVVAAFRDAFGLGGYDPAELGRGGDDPVQPEVLEVVSVEREPLPPIVGGPEARPYPPGPDPVLSIESGSKDFVLPDAGRERSPIVVEIEELLTKMEATPEDVEQILANRHVVTLEALTGKQAEELHAKLTQRLEFEGFVERVAKVEYVEYFTESDAIHVEPRTTVEADTVVLPDVPRIAPREESVAEKPELETVTAITES